MHGLILDSLVLLLLILFGSLSLVAARPDPPDLYLPPTALGHSHDNLTRSMCFCEAKKSKMSGAVLHVEYYSTEFGRTWTGDWACRKPWTKHHKTRYHKNECWRQYNNGGPICWDDPAGRDSEGNLGPALCDIPPAGWTHHTHYTFGSWDRRPLHGTVQVNEPKEIVLAFCEKQCQDTVMMPAMVHHSHSKIEYYVDLPPVCDNQDDEFIEGRGCVNYGKVVDWTGDLDKIDKTDKTKKPGWWWSVEEGPKWEGRWENEHGKAEWWGERSEGVGFHPLLQSLDRLPS